MLNVLYFLGIVLVIESWTFFSLVFKSFLQSISSMWLNTDTQDSPQDDPTGLYSDTSLQYLHFILQYPWSSAAVSMEKKPREHNQLL